MAKRNKELHKAATGKKDEFYTTFDDIAKELIHYTKHFKDKVVLCNCDDPYESNFFKYFALNFNRLGLKKLICTCWDGSTVSQSELTLFKDVPNRPAYKIELTEITDVNNDGAVDLNDVEIILQQHKPEIINWGGDFRAKEAKELMKEADIVVTNPPFSLFREYIAQLIEMDKKFLIIGNVNALTYKEVFPLIRSNKLWFGPSINSGDRKFFVPKEYPLEAANCGIDNGRKYIKVKGVRWFTNLEHKKRHSPLDLYKRYSPSEYPFFDNYDVINVKKVVNIPYDYDGPMAVPITFFDKYCPEQFEILNANDFIKDNRARPKKHGLIKDNDGTINGKATFARIIIQKKS